MKRKSFQRPSREYNRGRNFSRTWTNEKRPVNLSGFDSPHHSATRLFFFDNILSAQLIVILALASQFQHLPSSIQSLSNSFFKNLVIKNIVYQQFAFCVCNKKRENFTIFPSSGGEGNRTPVQTYSSKAFYMLICKLFVGIQQDCNKPIVSLAE